MSSPFHCFMPFLMKKKPMYSPLHCVSCPFDSLTALFLLGEKEYYKKQFATLRSFEEVDSLDSPHVADEEQDRIEQSLHERAMKISNWANIFLLLFKVIYFSFWNYPFSCLFVVSVNSIWKSKLLRSDAIWIKINFLLGVNHAVLCFTFLIWTIELNVYAMKCRFMLP